VSGGAIRSEIGFGNTAKGFEPVLFDIFEVTYRDCQLLR